RDALVSSSTSLRQTIEAITEGNLQIALVVDSENKLLGTVTDGDIRKAILAGKDLNITAGEAMRSQPITSASKTPRAAILKLMREKRIHQMPLLDDQGRVVDVLTVDDMIGAAHKPNAVVIMAGGLGTRLHPLTEETPKPMLKVGGKPILETIIQSFIDQGFTNFFVSVNYKANIISEYFGDGSRLGAKINYLHEKSRLGTAGGLSLLPRDIYAPIIVMNGDLLTRISVDALLDFHERESAVATMVVREDHYQVPYGVVEVDGTQIVGVEEKPIQRHLVNAGIYVISQDGLNNIPGDTFYDMPTHFAKLAANGHRTAAFPLHEYWVDIGRLDELERAQREWPQEIQ
ncbi:MAG: nucleotidyltransferase family protein, partial [Ilumatobacteraceae bacterium]